MKVKCSHVNNPSEKCSEETCPLKIFPILLCWHREEELEEQDIKHKFVTTVTLFDNAVVWGPGDVTHHLEISVNVPSSLDYPPKPYSFKAGDKVKVTIEKVKDD